ncbi:allophanate hydrolase [Pukyongia salina]|uniref:Allophanate hydrolase n=1 Tax=Pukyongia salina TaxID=2094025 RepID=A0A2S0HYF1_9FLAO|nr:biotin-dependent carboxyltransferase family protein [Pukyongia salina]AVI51717.1 allophanate hydrolase [Pukyongia salina]
MIEVQHPGMYSSIQDLGRYGFRKYGVPISGFMDEASAVKGNVLLGNDPNCAVLEFANAGPKLFFTKPAIIAVTGASFNIMLDGKEMNPNRAVLVNSNSVLEMGKAYKGVWGYLAIKGGITANVVLGSRSYFKGLTREEKLKKGDIIEISTLSESSSQEVSWGEQLPDMDLYRTIPVTEGPEFHTLSSAIRLKITDATYVISPQSNRMAYLLDHTEPISAKEIVTAPVQPGIVQLTPSGKMLVLMKDAQTTGGYSRIFHLNEKATQQIAQLRPGEEVRFKLV